jgi:hypothetical protein
MAPGVLLPEDSIMEDASSSDSAPDSTVQQPSSPPPHPVGDVPNDASDKENRKASLEDMFDDDSDDELMSSLVPADSSEPE